MIIGTVRPEEARIHDSHAGYHEFHEEETQEPYGSFEVFFIEPGARAAGADEYSEDFAGLDSGWYWWAAFPGCLPDGDPSGPFATSRDAREDADEWAPEFDPSKDDA